MGQCSNAIKKKTDQPWNPILYFIHNYPLPCFQANLYTQQVLKKYLEYKNMPNSEMNILYQDFQQFFPNISIYSDDSRRQVYRMLGFNNNERATNKNLYLFLMLINQVQNQSFLKDIFYYIYSSQSLPNSPSQSSNNRYPNRIMTQHDFSIFLKENQTKLDNKISKNLPLQGDQIVTYEDFGQVFQKYDYGELISLFDSRKRISEGEDLIERLKQDSMLSFEQGDRVYLVEYGWFREWYKIYRYRALQMKEKHNIQLAYQHNNNCNRKEKSQIQLPLENNEKNQIPCKKKLGKIQNYLLIGEQANKLKPEMEQFTDYVFVPHWMWRAFIILHGGYPEIVRKYPQIYTIKVVTVQIDTHGQFIPASSTVHATITLDTQIRHFLNTKQLHQKVYYKQPRVENWIQTKKQQIIGNIVKNGGLVYLCFFPEQVEQKFVGRYNYRMRNGQLMIKEGIKNYGSGVRVLMGSEKGGNMFKDGVITDILSPQTVQVVIEQNRGIYISHKFNTQQLIKLSPNSKTSSPIIQQIIHI